MRNTTFIVLFFLIGINLSAQKNTSYPYTITGIVCEAATGKPLAGIHIDIPGVFADITADDGRFNVKSTSDDVILEVTGNGYARQEIPVRGRRELRILLHEASYKGAQTMVLTPKGERSSTLLAHSWGLIREDNELSTAVTPDVLLQGYTSGVNTLFRSGMPGSGTNMYLHGFNTLNAGTMPLFVIDGMPYENSDYATSLIGNYAANPLASIDIKDIESITILKDGTSAYGVKGANGVVLIQTSTLKELKTTINAHVHMGINVEPMQLPVLNAGEHKTLLSEVLQQANPSLEPSAIQQLPYFDNTIPVMQPWGYEGNKDYYRYNHATNWQNEVYNSSFNQNYYLNISGGDEISVYTLSMGFLDQSGTLKNTHFQRFNTRLNARVKLTQKAFFQANMSYVYGSKSVTHEGADSHKNPMFAALLKAPFTTSHFVNEEGETSPNVEGVDVFGNSNPYVLANDASLLNINYRFLGSFLLGINVNKHLSLNALFGLNFNKERERTFYPTVGVAFDPINDVLIYNESQHRVDRLLSLYGDAYAQYDKTFSTARRLSARLGVRYQNNHAENDYGKGYNSSSDDFKSIQYGVPLLRRIGGSLGAWNWASIYGTADYILQNKYIFNLTLANDATSRSGENAPATFVYPSVAAAWLVSGERFMKNTDWLSLLKVRASYGLSGNDEIGNYSARRYYVSQGLLGNFGMAQGNLANTRLRPETIKRLNAGFDLSVLNERINLCVDIYSNTVKDMILRTTPDRRTGFTTYLSNTGSMRNTGIDINMNARVLNGPFKWDLGIMASKYKNEVLKLAGETLYTEVLDGVVQTKVGQPMGVFYGYETDGVYASTTEAQAAGQYEMHGLVQVPFGAGDVRFVNQTGNDKLIDENDQTIIGDPNPTLYGSIVNVFGYKKWSLNALMTYSLGNDVYNYTRSKLENLSTYNNQSVAVLARWKNEGNETSMPAVAYGDPMGNARFSDRWIEDGSYLRLKTLTLAYDLTFRNDVIQGCTLFATGENLFTLTKYKGTDPEFAYGQNPLFYGVDACVLAQPKTISIGLRLSL